MEDFENSCIKSGILQSVDSSTDSVTTYKSLKEIFKSAFINNCNLDDSSVTDDELRTLEELDQVEVVDNIKNLIEALLAFKSNYKSASTGELAIRCDQLEKMLQKQESEVRNHIKIEHQLKLHIDTNQQKILELEKNYSEAQATIKELEGKGLESMQTKLKKIEARFQCELNKVIKQYREEAYNEAKNNEKIKKLEEMYEKKEKAYVKLLQDYNKSKQQTEDSIQDYGKLKIENKGNNSRSISTGFKLRRSSYNDNLNKVQNLAKINDEEENKGKNDKKIANSAIKFDLKNSPLPDNRKIIGHIRSSSDSSKLVSSRKSKLKYK